MDYEGDGRIDGVPGSAATIPITFADVAGSTCGALLPTGRVVDEIEGVQATCIDNGMPVVWTQSDHSAPASGMMLKKFPTIRDDRYKLVFDAHLNRFEMFDVKGDTLEMDNLFDLQGQFRTQWQADLRALATSGLQTTG